VVAAANDVDDVPQRSASLDTSESRFDRKIVSPVIHVADDRKTLPAEASSPKKGSTIFFTTLKIHQPLHKTIITLILKIFKIAPKLFS
jgi:hypothetical protein